MFIYIYIYISTNNPNFSFNMPSNMTTYEILFFLFIKWHKNHKSAGEFIHITSHTQIYAFVNATLKSKADTTPKQRFTCNVQKSC